MGQSFVEMKKQIASGKRNHYPINSMSTTRKRSEEGRRGAKRSEDTKKEQSRIEECNNEVRATSTNNGVDGNFLNGSIDAMNNGIML